jgi:hypothetical protein
MHLLEERNRPAGAGVLRAIGGGENDYGGVVVRGEAEANLLRRFGALVERESAGRLAGIVKRYRGEWALQPRGRGASGVVGVKVDEDNPRRRAGPSECRGYAQGDSESAPSQHGRRPRADGCGAVGI